MESRRFDGLVRVLSHREIRRGVLAAAIGGAVGLLGLAAPDTSGHNALKKCKGKTGDKKKKCLKKAKAHNRKHQTEPEPECQTDGDCPDQVQFCQGGSCQTVCPSEAAAPALFAS
jgi:hypothetical protein